MLQNQALSQVFIAMSDFLFVIQELAVLSDLKKTARSVHCFFSLIIDRVCLCLVFFHCGRTVHGCEGCLNYFTI